MYTLKGIFPEPKKEQKKNFIKENVKQLKYIQGKTPGPKYTMKAVHPPRLTSATAAGSSQIKTSPSNKSINTRKKTLPLQIKKGDMAEFLKRKELRQSRQADDSAEEDVRSSASSGNVRDIGCQTVDASLAQQLSESATLTVLYPKADIPDDIENKNRASGDMVSHRSTSRRADDAMDSERNRSRLNAILDRKDTKDPYLPTGYQKGVLPKYLRERKEQLQHPEGAQGSAIDVCPPGHVALPDNERKETLRMLRNSFAELVSELNKLPVKTDTLRMRNRKMELEKQLAKLEEGIKVFSRPKVFVKIGE